MFPSLPIPSTRDTHISTHIIILIAFGFIVIFCR
jgi:hypothetical protein